MSTTYELDSPLPSAATTVQLRIELATPQQRVTVRVPGASLGRADAGFATRAASGEKAQRWAAKHYWTEETEAGPATVFEFDEPLPAGSVVLEIPFTRA